MTPPSPLGILGCPPTFFWGAVGHSGAFVKGTQTFEFERKIYTKYCSNDLKIYMQVKYTLIMNIFLSEMIFVYFGLFNLAILDDPLWAQIGKIH